MPVSAIAGKSVATIEGLPADPKGLGSAGRIANLGKL